VWVVGGTSTVVALVAIGVVVVRTRQWVVNRWWWGRGDTGIASIWNVVRCRLLNWYAIQLPPLVCQHSRSGST
jgi:hypothetical protein